MGLPASRTAFTVGGIWGVLAIAFEFGFGHYVAKDSWQALLHAYNVTDGQVWVAVPLWTVLGPEIIRRRRSRSEMGTCHAGDAPARAFRP